MHVEHEVTAAEQLQLLVKVAVLTIECHNFYTLEVLYAGTMAAHNAEPYRKSVEKLYTDITTLRDHHTHQLAPLLADYLTLACFAESRHAKRCCEVYLPPSELVWHFDRCTASQRALQYDPVGLLAFCEELFNESWIEGYGGRSWAKIARAALMWRTGQWNNITFIDHCWDLHHNNSVAFDKGFLILGPEAAYTLETFLARKATTITMTSWGTLQLSSSVRKLLQRYIYLIYPTEQSRDLEPWLTWAGWANGSMFRANNDGFSLNLVREAEEIVALLQQQHHSYASLCCLSELSSHYQPLSWGSDPIGPLRPTGLTIEDGKEIVLLEDEDIEEEETEEEEDHSLDEESHKVYADDDWSCTIKIGIKS